jgi:hypothetical protein
VAVKKEKEERRQGEAEVRREEAPVAQAGGAGAGGRVWTGGAGGSGNGGGGSGGAVPRGREVGHKSEQVPEHTTKAPVIVVKVKRERAQVPEHVDLGVKVEREERRAYV